MRIAYFLPVYKYPEQVSRLIARIYSPLDCFYVHKDKGTPFYGWENIFDTYRSGNFLFIAKYKMGWGTFRMVEATLDAMNYFSTFDYDYFINLSGQCYPIKPISMIKEELAKQNVADIECFKLPSSKWTNGGLDRINYFYFRVWQRHNIRIPLLKRTLPCNLEPYGGFTWFMLPKRFVNYILDYVSGHPEILRFYRYCEIPEEMFFATIIMNSPLKSDVVNDNKRYILWKKKPSPEILRKGDFDEIMRSRKLFARKFDINIDKDILDLIDKEILRTH